MLKRIISAEEFDGLESAVQAYYKKSDDEGKYALDLEGGDDDATKKLKEFRNNNIALQKAQKDLEDKLKGYEGIDADAAREALKQAQEMKDKNLMDQGKFDELMEQRTDRMKKEYEGQIKSWKTKAETAESSAGTYKSKLEEVLIDAELSKALSKVGTLKQDSLEYLLPRGKKTWKLNEETTSMTPIGEDGNVLYGSDAKTPLTADEWAKGIAQTTPWFFEDTKGAGASGSGGRQGRNIGDKMIDASDKSAFGSNLEDIAKGKVKVNMS